MKNIFCLLTILSLIMTGNRVYSQIPRRFPQLRERITEAKLREISKALQLDATTLGRLKPVYTRYENELAGINFQGAGQLMRVNADSLTSEEAEQMVQAQLQNAKKMIFIREKYYTAFKTVLSPGQIIKLYQTEAEIHRKVMQEVRKRFGNPR